MTTKQTHGGKRANSGRKAEYLPDDSVTTTVVFASDEQRQRFKKLGGSAWLRRMVEEVTWWAEK